MKRALLGDWGEHPTMCELAGKPNVTEKPTLIGHWGPQATMGELASDIGPTESA